MRELIRPRKNGLLADFHDIEGLTRQALKVLRDPTAYRTMGQAGAARVRERYSLDSSLSRLTAFYRRVCGETTEGVAT